MFHKPNHRRQNRNKDNHQNNQREILAHKREVAEQITSVNQQQYPHTSANKIKNYKSAALHLAHAGHKRRKSSNDRNKTRNQNRAPAILLIKNISALQIRFFEQPRIIMFKQCLA